MASRPGPSSAPGWPWWASPAWAVLITAKFWEGTPGEQVLRRFILMVVGLGLGLLAFVAAEAYWVRLVPFADMPIKDFHLQYRLPANFYGDDGRPLATAFMAAFGTLFLVLRWWPGRPVASGAAADLVGYRHGLGGLASSRPVALPATVAGLGGRHHVGGRAIGRPLVLAAPAAA